MTTLNIRGFTLIEILIVIGMIGILAATVLVAINPLHQFAQARNAQRISNVSALLNAISNRMVDNSGLIQSTSGCVNDLPSTATFMGNSPNMFDIRQCLVPLYISEVPYDPSFGSNTCSSDSCLGSIYNTGYTVKMTEAHRVVVCAPHSIDDGMNNPYCLSR